jgi:hypothetical protein
MPRLSRHETGLVISLLRRQAVPDDSILRLLARLEGALAASIQSTRLHRQATRSASAPQPGRLAAEEGADAG